MILLPEKLNNNQSHSPFGVDVSYNYGWNACLSEVARLNGGAVSVEGMKEFLLDVKKVNVGFYPRGRRGAMVMKQEALANICPQ